LIVVQTIGITSFMSYYKIRPLQNTQASCKGLKIKPAQYNQTAIYCQIKF